MAQLNSADSYVIQTPLVKNPATVESLNIEMLHQQIQSLQDQVAAIGYLVQSGSKKTDLYEDFPSSFSSYTHTASVHDDEQKQETRKVEPIQEPIVVVPREQESPPPGLFDEADNEPVYSSKD